jgi:hypothetical protein
MSRIPSNEQIEARAYELYLERGGENGHDVEDWLSAEKELTHRHDEIESIYAQEKEAPVKVGRGEAAYAGSSRR